MPFATPAFSSAFLIVFFSAVFLALLSLAAFFALVSARRARRFRDEQCEALRVLGDGLAGDLARRVSDAVGQALGHSLGHSLTQGLAVEMRASREELEGSLARGQGQLGEQLHRALGDVQVTLEGVDRRWNEIRTLGTDVARLRDIFEAPARRGRVLGEVTLERLLADCLPPGYYAFQHPIGQARVDAAVLFPHAGVVIPIDSKFPANGDAATVARLAREIHAKYVRPDLGTTPFAYLYLPNETLWHEAVGTPRVWEELVSLHVYPVSPHTLALSLRAAAHGVEYFERGRHAHAAVAAFEARARELAALGERASEGAAYARKALAAFTRVSAEIEELRAGLEAASVGSLSTDADFASSPESVVELRRAE